MGSSTTFTSSLLRDAEVRAKAGKLFEAFSGNSADWDDWTKWLFSHLGSRGLVQWFDLAVRGKCAIVSNGSPEERAQFGMLGGVARRCLVIVYEVDARLARSGGRASSVGATNHLDIDIGGRRQFPTARMLNFDSPIAQDVRSALGEDAAVGVDAAFEYDATAAARLEKVTDRLDSAWRFDPDSANTVKIKEWLACTMTVHRIIMYKAAPTVKLAASKVQKICGVDLFIALLEKHAKSGKEKMLMHMATIRTDYNSSGCSSILDYLDKTIEARLHMTGMSDEVFMVHVAEGLLDSDVSDYIKQAMNTDGIDLFTFIQGIQDRANSVFGKKLFVKANKATLERCQACGRQGHGFMQCRSVPKEAKEMVRETMDREHVHDRVKEAVECSHCGKKGHNEDNCWSKHPEKLKCSVCGSKEHRMTDCPRATREAKKARKAAAKVDADTGDGTTLSKDDLHVFRSIANYIKSQEDQLSEEHIHSCSTKVHVAGR